MRSLMGMFVLFAISVVGCAVSQKRLVDDLVRDGFGGVNSIKFSKVDGQGVLNFHSLVDGSGPSQIPLNSYRSLLVLPAPWGELRLHALPAEADAMKVQLGLSGNGRSDAIKRLPRVSVKTLAHALDAMPTLTSRPLLIDIYLAPMHSGREISATFPVSQIQLRVALMFPVGEGSPGVEWGGLMSLIPHELLHIHYRLAGMSPNKLDEEVAAYLTGYCGQAWSVIDMQAKEAKLTVNGVDKKVYQRVFPRLLEGRWEPHVDRFRSEFGISNPSAQGRMMTVALIYHRYAHDGVIDLADPKAVAPLLEDCRRLPSGPPRYSKGETYPSVP